MLEELKPFSLLSLYLDTAFVTPLETSIRDFLILFSSSS
jgi:hypothetical protein